MKDKITIATRKSLLAVAQAEYVKIQLQQRHHGLHVELLKLTTQGDQILDKPLAKIGGKGLFVKELEKAIYDGKADMAVHSMKDVPMHLPEGLSIPCVLNREDARDVLVSNRYQSLAELPQGAKVGTSSARRKAQLLLHYPSLDAVDIRGNVHTRLSKLDAGDYDAIILAAAGLQRVDLADRITEFISLEAFVPSPGQGALGVECRADDNELIALLKPLHDNDMACCVEAEREVSRQLDASCQLPLAAHAVLNGDQMCLTALVAMPDGSKVILAQQQGNKDQAMVLARQVVESLLNQNAREILSLCR